MIDIRNIKKSYGKFEVLKSVSLEINKGQILTLMGPNGSGKTTLLKCLLGLVLPDSGEIYVNGTNVSSNYKYREKIGYMPQTAHFPENIKVSDVLQIIKDIRGEKTAIDFEIYDTFGIENFVQKKISSLSQGMKQKVSASITFMFDSEILILDEPTVGLDPLSAEYLKDKLLKEKEKGKLILITTHILNEVKELSDRLIFLLEGQVRFDRLIETKEKDEKSNEMLKKFADLFKSHEWK